MRSQVWQSLLELVKVVAVVGGASAGGLLIVVAVACGLSFVAYQVVHAHGGDSHYPGTRDRARAAWPTKCLRAWYCRHAKCGCGACCSTPRQHKVDARGKPLSRGDDATPRPQRTLQAPQTPAQHASPPTRAARAAILPPPQLVSAELAGCTGLRVTWSVTAGSLQPDAFDIQAQAVVTRDSAVHRQHLPTHAASSVTKTFTCRGNQRDLDRGDGALPPWASVEVRVRSRAGRVHSAWSRGIALTTTLPKCALASYAVNLTVRARALACAAANVETREQRCASVPRCPHAPGSLVPVIAECVGREQMLQQVAESLARLDKPRVLIHGDAGVGKTALVRGLSALLLPENARRGRVHVPAALRGAVVLRLDVTSLSAGCATTGEYDERVQQLRQDLHRWCDRLVLVVEDLPSLLSPSDSGTSLVSSLLLPALSGLRPGAAPGRQQTPLRCIATVSTHSKALLDPHRALTRQFTPLFLAEMNRAQTLLVMASRSAALSAHYGVCVSTAAQEAAVDLTSRFLPSRCLPDKALDALDLACAALRPDAETDSRRVECCRGHAHINVTDADVAHVLAQWTGIPSTRLGDTAAAWLDGLAGRLTARVRGQAAAVEAVTSAIKRHRLGLASTARPWGVFLFVGATGVGKTELAKALSVELFGTERRMTRFDMSEYQEAHTVSRLLGAPPGYVGYGQGGALTEALKRSPFSVVLLDEIEKAHTRILDVLLQVFDDGRVTSSSGETVQCSNAVFIMTSNLGQTHQRTSTTDKQTMTAVRSHFRPELLSRVDRVVHFNPMSAELMTEVAELYLAEIAQRDFFVHRQITLEWSSDVVEWLAARAAGEGGARGLHHFVTEKLVAPLADEVLADQASSASASATPSRLVLRIDERLPRRRRRRAPATSASSSSSPHAELFWVLERGDAAS